jgi:hypothetical protein
MKIIFTSEFIKYIWKTAKQLVINSKGKINIKTAYKKAFKIRYLEAQLNIKI